VTERRDDLDDIIGSAKNRVEFWIRFIRRIEARSVAEVGVFRGHFAESVLEACPSVDRYYMIDPWRHLDDWNKPANVSSPEFERLRDEALARTERFAARRVVLRGRTADVIDQIPARDLDLAYIDGDHTLRGITIDLLLLRPKVKPGGFIGGDDFVRSVWQHDRPFEPTLVFPFAVHFAEATESRIDAVGFDQFLLHVPSGPGDSGFQFVDHTASYGSTALADTLAPPDRTARRSPAALIRGGRRLARRVLRGSSGRRLE
jgi:hypothetical protein